MGILKFVAIAALAGTGIVALSQRQQDDSLGAALRSAGEQAVAAKALCAERPALCATVVSSAADLARQEIARRMQDAGPAPDGTTGKITAGSRSAALPAHPPLPPRRPGALP